MLSSSHVSCEAYSDSYYLLNYHCVWVTVTGPLPAEEASLFLTIIPTEMASFYKYRRQSTERPSSCAEALGSSSALLPQPGPSSQSVLLPKGLTPYNLDNTCQYQLSLQSTEWPQCEYWRMLTTPL